MKSLISLVTYPITLDGNYILKKGDVVEYTLYGGRKVYWIVGTDPIQVSTETSIVGVVYKDTLIYSGYLESIGGSDGLMQVIGYKHVTKKLYTYTYEHTLRSADMLR